MKNILLPRFVTWLLVIGCTIPVSSCSEAGTDDSPKKSKVDWFAFDKGMERARTEDKLLVVDFYTDWCHWCKVMDKETYANQKVIDFVDENAIMVKLNPETAEGKFKFREAKYSGRELSMMFGVTGFPTTVFIDSKGELLSAVPGFIPPEKFMMILKYLAGNWYEKMKFDEFIEKEEAKTKG